MARAVAMGRPWWRKAEMTVVCDRGSQGIYVFLLGLVRVKTPRTSIIVGRRKYPSTPYVEYHSYVTIELRACSLGGILEEFRWFGRMLEEFVREKYCSG